ncbi:MAG: hypothetical protein PHE25_01985 [Candidatus Gracilibacteria bacterium]|nr:hypothetical protein [Candidatus Gracilibacteria bacterium]
MHFFISLFYSALLIGIGYLILRYRRTVKSWTGNFVWAEKYLGHGGTYFILILIGCFLIFWGVLYPFGGLELIFGVSSNSQAQIKGF